MKDLKKTCKIAEALDRNTAYVSEAEYEACDKYRHSCLSEVAAERHKSSLTSEGTEHVGHTTVTRAVLADVVLVHKLREENCRVYTSEQIRSKQNDEKRAECYNSSASVGKQICK